MVKTKGGQEMGFPAVSTFWPEKEGLSRLRYAFCAPGTRIFQEVHALNSAWLGLGFFRRRMPRILRDFAGKKLYWSAENGGVYVTAYEREYNVQQLSQFLLEELRKSPF